MYDYEWDGETGGYILSAHTGRYIANEIRPVFAEEIELLGMNDRLQIDPNETRPYMWAQKNIYFYCGEKIAQTNNVRYGRPISIDYFFEGSKALKPVDIGRMLQKRPYSIFSVSDAQVPCNDSRSRRSLPTTTRKRSRREAVALAGCRGNAKMDNRREADSISDSHRRR